MLNLKIIIGSTRPGRAAGRVIPWITALSRQHGAFDAEVADLRDWDLPMFGENLATVGDPRNPAFSAPVVRRWNDTIAAGDAYLFVTPEYNHSVPAVLAFRRQTLAGLILFTMRGELIQAVHVIADPRQLGFVSAQLPAPR